MSADGAIREGAFVLDGGSTVISPLNGRCGTPRCGCSEGTFIQRLFPRDAAGTVFGHIVEFDSREEMSRRALNRSRCWCTKAMH
jgi:hypothetical protein